MKKLFLAVAFLLCMAIGSAELVYVGRAEVTWKCSSQELMAYDSETNTYLIKSCMAGNRAKYTMKILLEDDPKGEIELRSEPILYFLCDVGDYIDVYLWQEDGSYYYSVDLRQRKGM